MIYKKDFYTYIRFICLLLVIIFIIYSFIFYYNILYNDYKYCKWVRYKYICNEENAPWPVIDIVYTWVNGSDPILKEQLQNLKNHLTNKILNNEEKKESDEASASRFADNEEFRYSLRSIEKYAPWIRHIYLVTNGQVPNWLNIDHPQLTIIPHEDIFPNKSHLPTFSSPAIESHLHRIPGLADHFIYFNDDVMLGGPTYPDDFKSPSDGTKIYLSWGVPTCNQGCPYRYIGDGKCNEACNVSLCHYDKGDCDIIDDKIKEEKTFQEVIHDKINKYKEYKGELCSENCPTIWLGDGNCDNVCNYIDCGYDGGDCGINLLYNIPQLVLTLHDNTYNFPFSSSLIINASNIIPNNYNILRASFDRNDIIRSAVISKEYKYMDLTFYFNIFQDSTIQQFKILLELESLNNEIKEYMYEISLFYNNSSNNNCNNINNNTLNSNDIDNETNNNNLFGIPYYGESIEEAVERLDENISIFSKKPNVERKVLDTFGDSLRFVDFLLSEEFGFEHRKVPAHMPHMIQKPILQELQYRFDEEWNMTSSHQLRDSKDMQYSFSFFYYLINQEPYFSNEFLFNISDVDSNGILDINELRTVAIRAYGHPIKQDKFKEMLDIYKSLSNMRVDKRVFTFHSEVLDKLREYYHPRYKNKYIIKNADDVAFLMVNQNDTQLEEKLDGIREKQHKFICLNDNIDHSSPKAKDTVKLIHNFYNSLVPNKSSFELDENKIHTEQYLDNIIQKRILKWEIEILLIIIISILLSLIFIYYQTNL